MVQNLIILQSDVAVTMKLTIRLETDRVFRAARTSVITS